MASVVLPAIVVALGFAAGVVLLRTILHEITAVRRADRSPDEVKRVDRSTESASLADLTDDEPRLILD